MDHRHSEIVATYSIDSSPAARVPATTETCARADAARRRAPGRSRAAPPTLSRAIACTTDRRARSGHRLSDSGDAHRRDRADQPSVTQNIAAIGWPPNSAEPASVPASAASHAAGKVRGELVVVGLRPAADGSCRRANGQSGQSAERADPDQAELVEHLVVALLGDERAGRGREVARRLIREPRACGREEACVLRRRQLAPPARSQHRPVDEDPVADVGEDEPLTPAAGVLARLRVLRRREPLAQEAQVGAAQAVRPAGQLRGPRRPSPRPRAAAGLDGQLPRRSTPRRRGRGRRDSRPTRRA